MLPFFALRKTTYKKWWILLAMSLSLGMTYIDQTGLAVALPKIQQYFDLSSIAAQWVINAFILALAVFLMIGGRLGDIFEHHKVVCTGIFLFMCASISCAIAQNYYWIIISRVIQGFGAALILPNTAAILISTFSPEEKGRAMGIYVGSALLFSPLALMLGGFFSEYLSWRFIFWINLPLSVLCLWIIFQVVEFPQVKQKKSFDWTGAFTLIIALASLVIALMESANVGWNSVEIQSLLACSAIFFILFYLVEQKPDAIVDFSLFKNHLFICALLLLFAMSISMAFFIFDSIFFQQTLAYTPSQTAFLFFPNIFIVAGAAPLAGRMLDKYGYQRPVILGLVFILVGLLLKAYIVPWQNYWYLLPAIFLLNSGAAFVISPINTATLSSIGQAKRGAASGTLTAIRQISNSITLAILIIIMTQSNQYYLSQFLKLNQAHYPTISLTDFMNVLHQYNGGGPLTLQIQQLIAAARASFAAAYSFSLYVCAVFIAIVFIITLFLFSRIKNKVIKNNL